MNKSTWRETIGDDDAYLLSLLASFNSTEHWAPVEQKEGIAKERMDEGLMDGWTSATVSFEVTRKTHCLAAVKEYRLITQLLPLPYRNLIRKLENTEYAAAELICMFLAVHIVN